MGTKTTALTALAVPTSDDLFLMIDDPGGAPVGKKATFAAVEAALNLVNILNGGQAMSTSSSPTLAGLALFSAADTLLTIDATANTTQIRFLRAGTHKWSFRNNSLGTDIFSLFNNTTAVSPIAVSQTDNVGIGGVSAPAAKLDVLQPTLGTDVLKLQSTATNDDPNLLIRQNRVATTDATVTTLETITIAATTTYLIEARVVARRTGGAAGTAEDGAAYIRYATVKNVAGTATLIGAVAATATMEDQAGWDCTIDVTAATARVRVTGAVNNNVTWHSTVKIQNLST